MLTNAQLISIQRMNGMVFFDVGANKGEFSKGLYSYFDAIYAFEPYAFFHGNLRGIGNKVTVVGKAVWSGKETKSLHSTGDQTCNLFGIGRLVGEVQTISIDEFVVENHVPTLTLLKIDTEGAEEEVLHGAENTLKKFKPYLDVEVHDYRKIPVFHDYLSELGIETQAVANHLVRAPLPFSYDVGREVLV